MNATRKKAAGSGFVGCWLVGSDHCRHTRRAVSASACPCHRITHTRLDPSLSLSTSHTPALRDDTLEVHSDGRRALPHAQRITMCSRSHGSRRRPTIAGATASRTGRCRERPPSSSALEWLRHSRRPHDSHSRGHDRSPLLSDRRWTPPTTLPAWPSLRVECPNKSSHPPRPDGEADTQTVAVAASPTAAAPTDSAAAVSPMAASIRTHSQPPLPRLRHCSQCRLLFRCRRALLWLSCRCRLPQSEWQRPPTLRSLLLPSPPPPSPCCAA